MDLTRRSFVHALGRGGIAALALPLVAGRGREASAGEQPKDAPAASKAPTLRLDSNENPHGPADAALEALRAALPEAGRYPDAPAAQLEGALASFHGLTPEHVVRGCGSTEILRMAAQAFTSRERALVTAAPSFEAPARFAELAGASITAIPVTESLELDLPRMAAKAAGAGLVYVCNPNNPTASVGLPPPCAASSWSYADPPPRPRS